MSKILFKRLAALFLVAFVLTVRSQTITTVCGTGTAGFSGDNGPAINARIDAIYAQIACDKFGNLYIADDNNHRIRKIDAITGSITTVAGTGTAGFSGDGGLATAAQLTNPDGIAIDNTGNIYIADYNNHRIRKIDPIGTITTICGNGTQSSTGDGGLATAATINGPGHLCLDPSGNLYITEYNSNRIRKIATTGTITTFCGTGVYSNTGDGGLATAATIGGPWAIASDAAGNIYTAEYLGAYVRKIATNGTITAFAGINASPGFSGDNGVATAAQLNGVAGLVVNDLGEVFIADSANHRIRKVATTGTITTYVGTGVMGFSGDGGLASAAQIKSPNGGLASYGCSIFINDVGNQRIRKVIAGSAPSLSVTSTATPVLCVGQTATLSVSGASTYVWNSGAITSSISISPTITSNYTVYGTASNGCKNASVFSQSVSTCAGINEIKKGNAGLIIYPNPTTDQFSIEAESATKVIVTDILGKVVMEIDLEKVKTVLSLGDLKNGVYMLSVYDGQTLKGNYKVVKE